jgi:hypothetical protein
VRWILCLFDDDGGEEEEEKKLFLGLREVYFVLYVK